MGDKDSRKPESPFRFPSLVNYQPRERNITPHPHYRQTRLPPPKTPRRYATIFEDQALRPISRRSGKTIQRTTEENLRRRDNQRLDAILSRGQPHWLEDSRSDTNLFKTPQRSAQIIKDLRNDGFIAKHRYGGLAFDVSLRGRPVRLSPIGAPDRRYKRSKKRKKSHKEKGGKRKKNDKKGENRHRENKAGADVGQYGTRRGSDFEDYEDWEDVDEEEEE